MKKIIRKSIREVIVLSILFLMLFDSKDVMTCNASENSTEQSARVLFLSSYDYDWDSVPSQLNGISEAIGNYAKVEYIFMDTKKHPYEDVKESIYTEIAEDIEEYGAFDVVILGDDTALDFGIEFQNELFAGIPLVFEGINSDERANQAAEKPLITGVVESFPIEETIQLAVNLMPNATKIVAISDETEAGKGSTLQFYNTEDKFPGLEYEELNCSKLTEREIKEEIASYGEDTILLYLMMTHDSTGNNYSHYEAVNIVTSVAKVPVFKSDELGIGQGIFGGVTISYEEMGRIAGEMAVKILEGTPVDEIEVTTISSRPIFDEKVMKQFGIKASQLPEDSVFINHVPTFWEKYHKVLIPLCLVIGLMVGIIMILFVGISRRRKLYEEIREKNQMQNGLLKNIPGGLEIFRLGKKPELLYYSEGIPELTGRTVEEYENCYKNAIIPDYVYQEDVEVFQHAMTQAMKKDIPLNMSYRLVHKDGSLIWVQFMAERIHEKKGEPLYYAIMTKMSQENVSFRKIANDSPSGVYVVDCDNYEMLYANEKLRNEFGAGQNYEGKTCYQYLQHRDAPCEDCEICNMAGDHYLTREIFMADGDKHVVLRGKTIGWNGKKAHIEYVNDDTQHYKKQQVLLEKALDEAKEAGNAKSEFISRMSHDMRTPLNAILNLTTSEMLDGADESRKDKYLKEIHTSGNYLLGIINDVLDMSKMASHKVTLKMEPYLFEDFAHVIDTVIGEQCKEKKIEFYFDKKCHSDVMILTDRIHFNQIFMNLLSNAIKFTPEGGRIDFTIEDAATKEFPNRKRFTVQDNGIGMSKEFLPHVFENFAQEIHRNQDANNLGTGLGLAIVKHLVELFQGTIQVESELEKGSKFIVELDLKPVTDLESQPVRQEKKIEKGKASETKCDVLRGKKILIFEDHPINAQITQRLLERKGCVVTRAENGKDGVDIYKKLGAGYFDAILMDIRMPVMDGIEATKVIREMGMSDSYTIPIIAMTANAYTEDAKTSLEAGMNAHLGKPVEPKTLYETLESFFEKVF